MKQSITLYHANSHAKCEDFLKNKQELIIADEHGGKWLGKGMYFWDNLSNAHYWCKEKIRKEKIPYCSIVTVVACFEHENMLDLSDFEEHERIYNLWIKYCEITNTPSKEDIGTVLNTLFNALPEFHNKYHIIKAIGSNYVVHSQLIDNYNNKKVSISLKSKVIYNIRVAHIISEREIKEIYYD